MAQDVLQKILARQKRIQMDFSKPWLFEIPKDIDLKKEYKLPSDLTITFEETDALQTYTTYEVLRKWMESCKASELTEEQKKQISDNIRSNLPQEVLDLIPPDATIYLESVDFDCPHNENTITVEYGFSQKPDVVITFDNFEDKPDGNS